ncbi:MAG: ATP-binding cassette domain-containing protein [Ignisphaera sp.]
MREPKVLEVKDLKVEARGRTILNHISFSIDRGETLLILGRSGSGKTTLLRALTFIAKELFDMVIKGSIEIYGEKIHNSYSASKHIYYIVQEPWFSISTPYPYIEIMFYSGNNSQKIINMAKEFGIHNCLWSSTSSLSAGEIERIALLEAYISRKDVILIDEASSYLDTQSRYKIVKLVKKLKNSGVSTIVVDHDVELWRGVVDSVLYIDNGSAKIYEDPKETPIYDDLTKLNEYAEKLSPCSSNEDEIVIEARDVWFKYPDGERYVINGMDIDIEKGGITWIKGTSGSGKSTLLKILAGILKPVKGSIKRPKGIQFIPENPLYYISSPTPREELMNRIDIAKKFNLERALDTPIAMLSSGERRRLAIASAFIRQPKVLLIDEPTVGLDPWNAMHVLESLCLLAKHGCGIAVASHGEELRYISNKVIELG